MLRYLVVIENAGSNFSAFCPDVPGCVATGDTVENTVKNMKEALEFHLKDEIELSEAHDLKFLQNHGAFNQIAEEFYISSVRIELPQTP